MDLAIQPIVIMYYNMTREEFRGFLKGNQWKYSLRADGKNGIEDREKATVYNNWLMELDSKGPDHCSGKDILP